MLRSWPCLSLAAAATTVQANVQVAVVSDKETFETEATFASWNIDSSCNRGFHHINFTNPNLRAAAKGLQPSKLRFGGSGNDNLVYGLSPGSPECTNVMATDCGYITPGCLNATHWDNLYDMAVQGGAEFIFGVSWGLEQACKEGSSYTWNSSNVARLLDYVKTNNQNLWGFELGNEVNNNGGAPCNQTAVQQAAAQALFSEVVKSQMPRAKLLGPDTGYKNWQAWLQEYLAEASSLPQGQRLHAVTHHVYAGINPENFNSAKQLDKSAAEVSWYSNTIRHLVSDAQVWVGEHGATGGGNDGTCGSNAACGTYATTLWYADDLATRAKNGFSQYQRQDLFGGAYGLINSPTSDMALSEEDAVVLRPDYWINFLWKRTLGTKVFNATSSSSEVRAYAFAGLPPSPFSAVECRDASMQFLLIHLNDTNATHVSLPESGSSNFSAWTLSPSSEGPHSQLAELNGQQLPTTVDVSEAPATFLKRIQQEPKVQRISDGITLAPLSATFLCLSPSMVSVTV